MFKNLTVKVRLFLLIAFMILVMFSLTGLNLFALHQTNAGLKTVYVERTVPLANLAEIKALQTQNRLHFSNIAFEPEKAAQAIEVILENKEQIHKLWEAYISNALTSDEKVLAEKYEASNKAFLDGAFNPMVEFIQKGELEEAQKIRSTKLKSLGNKLAKEIDSLVQLQKDLAKQEYENAQQRYTKELVVSAVMLAIGAILSVWIGTIIIKNLLRELGGEPNYAAQIVREVANGNLSVHVALQANDENSLLYSIESMRQTLSNIVTNTSTVMDDMARGELGSQINVEVKGDFVKLKMSINETISQLRVTLFALNDIMYALYNADFSKTISGHVKGKFKETLEHAMETQHSLREMLTDISHVMRNVAAGDINQRVVAEGRGELLDLKDNINHTLVALKSLTEIEHVVESLAHGDLTRTINSQYPGVFGNVTESLNNTVDSLKALIGEIKTSSDVIASVATEISMGNNDLSHRTEEQASSLQETASSMEELSSTVQQNTANAKEASEMIMGASTMAQKGVQAVNNVVATMGNINESSRKIVDIITTIDDIAFQTNILALNAAVEASRAGEQGKGFAVVATEVRSLAQRAAKAAGEIKYLIDASVHSISEGSKQVDQAGKTMEDIVSAIKNAVNIMNDIVMASSEQSAGIKQVYQAITQMDAVTQQNATLVEQAAAATNSLSDQTKRLSQEMTRFKMV